MDQMSAEIGPCLVCRFSCNIYSTENSHI